MGRRIRADALFVAVFILLGDESAVAQTTERVSVDSSGAQGNSSSNMPSISADGRWVAFTSSASNLVAGDTNTFKDTFVHDRVTGTTERVSVDSFGVQGNDQSLDPKVSADGRWVAFTSAASNLVAGDTNGWWDVFLRDRQAGTTERVSVTTTGAQGDNHSYQSSVSSDGRFVAFQSRASNLVAGDTNASDDIFVRDLTLGTTERVSVDSGGVQGNNGSINCSISSDGRFVAFNSLAYNLAVGDTNALTDVFVHDRVSGTTERVSVATSGAQGNDASFNPSLSADGRFVAFESVASNLVAGDSNGKLDVFVHDRLSGTTERVSVATTGAQGNQDCRYPSISADGVVVSFGSYASNLVSGDTNARWDVFVHDRHSGITERVSVDSSGAQANDSCNYPVPTSAGGRFVAFPSLATNLVAGDTNGGCPSCGEDIFVRDRVGPPMSYCTAGTTTNGCSASLMVTDHPSITLAHSCTITVTHVEGLRSGILFYGLDNSGFAPSLWGPGSTSWLCVKHPAQRTPIQNSGGTFGTCDGSLVLDWNAYQSAHPLALGNPWSAGDKVYVQASFRDPLAVKATNLSNALEMTYVP